MEEVEDVEEVVERATAWWGAARWCCRVIVRARYRNINMIYKVKVARVDILIILIEMLHWFEKLLLVLSE